MLLFVKSLIGTYCNRLYDSKERQDLFSCKGRFKANSAGKNLNVTNITRNTKAGPSNRQTAHFFNCQNDHHLSGAIIFDCFTSLPPFTLLEITNGCLCHRSFFFNTSGLDS